MHARRAGQAQPVETDWTNGHAAEAVVARGNALLALLSQQAAAARAEAQCAELRLLLSEAQSGDLQGLRRWLDAHAAPAEGTADSALGGGPIVPTAHFPLSLRTASALKSSSQDSWESLLPAARQRLRRRAELLRLEQVEASPAAANKTAAAANKTAATANKAAAPRRRARRPQPSRATLRQPSLPGSLQWRQLPSQVTVDLPQSTSLKPALFASSLPSSRIRGMATSLVAHVGLIVLLALMTLRLPAPPASLALTTSSPEATLDSLEISEPLQVSAPEAELSATVAVETFDPAMTISEVSPTTGKLLTEVSINPSNSISSHSISNPALTAIGALGPMSNSASFFGAAASGNCFCYVIDGSASMRNGPWEAAKRELLQSLLNLKAKQRFYIIFFNRELSALPAPGERTPAPRALYASPENLAHARSWVDSLRIGYGAPPNDALRLAIEKEPDAIYLLTDGVTTVDVAKFLHEENRVRDIVVGEQVRVPIHTIAFYSLEGQELLRKIAAENRGKFTYVPDPRKK